ncbi:MAG: VOC family protein [Rhodospirillales bacterium]
MTTAGKGREMQDGIRYRKLGYVALNVTDLGRSVPFYRDAIGLDLVGQEPGVAYLRCSGDHHNVVLYEARTPGLKRIGWEVEDAAALDFAEAHLARHGLAPVEVAAEERAALRQGRTIRFREPNTGVAFELYSDITQLAAPYAPPHTQIARLGHVVMWCADHPAALRFVTETLNFKVSDHFGEVLTFLRCFPNPYHHSLALGRGTENRLHHVNFMVTDIDDIGRAMHRLARAGIEVVYGPGKHPPSNSIFLYFLDPDGMSMEYSFGMEEFPEHGPRKPRLMEPVQASLDAWASPRDPRFATGGVVEPMPAPNAPRVSVSMGE